jgi:hypothetical protein
MTEQNTDRDRLQADGSQADLTPLACHEDALSPARVIREHSGADGEGSSQRIGNTGVQGPTVSFPGPADQAPDPAPNGEQERVQGTSVRAAALPPQSKRGELRGGPSRPPSMN